MGSEKASEKQIRQDCERPLTALFNQVSRLEQSRMAGVMKRVMEIQPDENGKIKVADIRKAVRG